MGDFLRIVNVEWSEKEFYEYFREIGIIISSSFDNL
jgi:hypothetical protein